jgi:hypothetical protein
MHVHLVVIVVPENTFDGCRVDITTAEDNMSEMARLGKLQQQPAHAERLLHTLVVRANLVPEGAHQIRNFASMPKELRIIAALAATTNGHTWSCWTHEQRTWLFTGELSVLQSRARGVPVLLVDVYDEAGSKGSGLWAYGEGTWHSL